MPKKTEGPLKNANTVAESSQQFIRMVIQPLLGKEYTHAGSLVSMSPQTWETLQSKSRQSKKNATASTLHNSSVVMQALLLPNCQYMHRSLSHVTARMGATGPSPNAATNPNAAADLVRAVTDPVTVTVELKPKCARLSTSPFLADKHRWRLSRTSFYAAQLVKAQKRAEERERERERGKNGSAGGPGLGGECPAGTPTPTNGSGPRRLKLDLVYGESANEYSDAGVSQYHPPALFSSCPGCVDGATRALFDAPENNLLVFVDGELQYGKQVHPIQPPSSLPLAPSRPSSILQFLPTLLCLSSLSPPHTHPHTHLSLSFCLFVVLNSDLSFYLSCLLACFVPLPLPTPLLPPPFTSLKRIHVTYISHQNGSVDRSGSWYREQLDYTLQVPSLHNHHLPSLSSPASNACCHHRQHPMRVIIASIRCVPSSPASDACVGLSISVF